MKLNDRLKSAKKRAELTISDMGVWFEIYPRTMQTWLEGTEPHPCRHSQIKDCLDLLEKAIKQGCHFPVPLSVTQYERKKYIEEVRNAVSDRVSSARSAKRRV